jgi:hypothetical protein
MSNLPPGAVRPRRHALGLPAGSVRALLTLLVVGMTCILLLLSPHKGKPIPIPPYLLYLLFMGLGHFFAAHGTSIARPGSGEPAPLFLPSALVKLLIVGLLAATVVWKFTKGYDDFQQQLTASMEEIPRQPFLPVILLAGFFLGVILHMLAGWEHPPPWFQDFEAWVALLAVFGLAIDAMIYLVINPSLENPLDSYELQGFIAAAVAFYFGARS